MSLPPSKESAAQGKDKGSTASTRRRAAPPRGAPPERTGSFVLLADVLQSAEKCAHVLASFTVEFETSEAAQACSRALAQLKRDDRQFSKHLFVDKTGRSLHIFYNPQAFPALPGRELAHGSMRELVRRGELIRAADFADALGVTKQAVSKALRNKRVFTLEVDGAQYYPRFYLDSRLDRRQIERVTKALDDLPGPSKLQFFLTRKHSLGGITPLKALAKGKLEEVEASARGFAQR